MKRSHIIGTAALVLAVAGFATSRHFSDHSPDIVSGKEYQPTATVAERNNKESENMTTKQRVCYLLAWRNPKHPHQLQCR